MTTNRLRIGIQAAMLLLIVTSTVIWLLIRSNENDQQSPSQPATEQQQDEFLELYLRYYDALILARRTGDISTFPGIFYNDSAFDISKRAPDCKPIIDRYDDQITAVLVLHGEEAQASTTGILSCSIADILYLHESASAWEAVQTQAAAEGRPPSIVDMPDGLQPVDLPVSREQTVELEWHIVKATVQEDHATVEYNVGPSGGSWQVHMLLINRDGVWYISGLWTSGTP